MTYDLKIDAPIFFHLYPPESCFWTYIIIYPCNKWVSWLHPWNSQSVFGVFIKRGKSTIHFWISYQILLVSDMTETANWLSTCWVHISTSVKTQQMNPSRQSKSFLPARHLMSCCTLWPTHFSRDCFLFHLLNSFMIDRRLHSLLRFSFVHFFFFSKSDDHNILYNSLIIMESLTNWIWKHSRNQAYVPCPRDRCWISWCWLNIR